MHDFPLVVMKILHARAALIPGSYIAVLPSIAKLGESMNMNGRRGLPENGDLWIEPFDLFDICVANSQMVMEVLLKIMTLHGIPHCTP